MSGSRLGRNNITDDTLEVDRDQESKSTRLLKVDCGGPLTGGTA